MKNLQFLGALSNLGNPSGGAINYLLYDKFLNDLAAGSINATTATPIGGTRTVTDTLSRLSISSGILTKASGTNTGAGDSGIWWPSLIRRTGQMVLGTHTSGNYLNYNFGWDANQTGGTSCNINFQTASVMRCGDGTNTVSVGTPPSGATIYMCIVQRATGYYYFIKDTTDFLNWTLIWISSTNNNTPMFPNVSANVSTTNAFAFDNIRVPVNVFIPTPLAYDTFTRANGALGTSETTGLDSQAVVGRTWTDTLGTSAISSNAASFSALSGGSAFVTVDPGVADIFLDTAFTRSAGVGGLVLRYANSTNYIIAYHDGTNAKLDKVIGGSTTSVISAAATYSAGATLRVVCSGSSFQLFYNNVKIGSTSTISDAAVQTTTVHGLYTTNIGNTFDNFLIMPRGTNNEYGVLDRY